MMCNTLNRTRFYCGTVNAPPDSEDSEITRTIEVSTSPEPSNKALTPVETSYSVDLGLPEPAYRAASACSVMCGAAGIPGSGGGTCFLLQRTSKKTKRQNKALLSAERCSQGSGLASGLWALSDSDSDSLLNSCCTARSVPPLLPNLPNPS